MYLSTIIFKLLTHCWYHRISSSLALQSHIWGCWQAAYEIWFVIIQYKALVHWVPKIKIGLWKRASWEVPSKTELTDFEYLAESHKERKSSHGRQLRMTSSGDFNLYHFAVSTLCIAVCLVFPKVGIVLQFPLKVLIPFLQCT